MSLWEYRPQPFTGELKYVDATTLALAEAAAITQSTGFDATYGVVLVDEDEAEFLVEHGDTLTGDGTAADPLDTVFGNAVIHDGTITGSGTAADPLAVHGSIGQIVHDNTLSGEGVTGDPLKTVFGNEVVHDNTLTGKGTTAEPLSVISGADSDATNLKDVIFISNNGLDTNAGLNSTEPKKVLQTVTDLLPTASTTYRSIKCDDVSAFVAPTAGGGLLPHERLVVDMPDCSVTGTLFFTGNDNEIRLGRIESINIAYRTTLVVDSIIGGGVAALYFRTNEGGPQQSSVKCGIMGPGDEINLLNVIGEIHLEIDVYQADIAKMLSFIHVDAIVTGWVGSHNFDAGIALKDTIYISNNGDDAATGTHPSRPKADLGLVIDALPISSTTYRGIKCDDVSTFAAPTSNNGLIQHDHLTVDMPDASITGLISFDGNDNDIRIGHVEKINVAYRTNLVIDTIIGGGLPALYFRVGEGIPHNNSIKVRYMGPGDQLVLQDVEGFIHLEIDVYESSIATMLSFINTDVVITGWVGSHHFDSAESIDSVGPRAVLRKLEPVTYDPLFIVSTGGTNGSGVATMRVSSAVSITLNPGDYIDGKRYFIHTVEVDGPDNKVFDISVIDGVTGEVATNTTGYFGGAGSTITIFNEGGFEKLTVSAQKLLFQNKNYIEYFKNGYVSAYYAVSDYNELPDATEGGRGLVQLATFTEADEGTNLTKAVSPARIRRAIGLGHGLHYVQTAAQTVITSSFETSLEIAFLEFDGRTPQNPQDFEFVTGGYYEIHYSGRSSSPAPHAVRVSCVFGNSAVPLENVKSKGNILVGEFSVEGAFVYSSQFTPTTGIKLTAYVGVNTGSVTLEDSTLTIVRIK